MNKLLAFLLVCVCSLSLAACDKAETATDEEENTAATVQAQADEDSEPEATLAEENAEEAPEEMLEEGLLAEQEAAQPQEEAQPQADTAADSSTERTVLSSDDYICYVDDVDYVWAYMTIRYISDGSVSVSLAGSGIFNYGYANIDSADGTTFSGIMTIQSGDGVDVLGDFTLTISGNEASYVVDYYNNDYTDYYTFTKE